MSKLLVNLALLQAKALVNAYTFATLPIYALVQRPWRRLKLSQATGIQITVDLLGRKVYSRPSPLNIQHPYLNCYSFNEMIPYLDRNKEIIGLRDVLSEVPQLDADGQPIKIDGKELIKMKLADKYRWFTVGQILDRADAMGRALQKMGVKPGTKVCLFAENSLEWLCIGIALMRINAITVTLLSILSDEGIVYGINQCEARYLITSEDLLKQIDKISASITNPLDVVYIGNKFTAKGNKLRHQIDNLTRKNFKVTSLDQLEKMGNQCLPTEFPVPNPKDITLIMYTSGTTGNPKGVMLTHEQLTSCMKNVLRFDHELDNFIINTRFVSYLPFGHLYGYLLSIGLFCNDAKIGLCNPLTMLDSSPGHVPGQVGDIKLIKPQFLPGVPLVLNRILNEVNRKLESRGQFASSLFTYLMDYKIRWRERGFDTPLINKFICEKINEQFGGEFKVMLIGSAPLNKRTQALGQAALNIQMIQAYGSTEQGGATIAMHNESLSYGDSGVPFHSVKYYLKDWQEGNYFTTDKPNPRGEIVVGGDVLCEGYYKMPMETQESFKVDPDGTRWFESGDIGEVLPNGSLKVIDRKKDLIKLANGEFISLGQIESGLRSSPYVENICVCSDMYSNYVVALITAHRKSLVELAVKLSKSNLTFEQLCDDPEVITCIHKSLSQLSSELNFKKNEMPAVIRLCKEEWTPDNNLLTAALKVKRKQVHEFYQDQIKEMFRAGSCN